MALSAKAAARYVLAAAAAIVLPASIVAAASIAHPTDHSASRHPVRAASGPTRGSIRRRGAARAGGDAPGVSGPARGVRPDPQLAAGGVGGPVVCRVRHLRRVHEQRHQRRTRDGQRHLRRRIGRPAHRVLLQPDRPGRLLPAGELLGMYDRGLWQIDNQAWTSISDTCAFMAKCNADGAYAISQRGASFTPWATYTSGTYSHYLAAAQTAVRALRGWQAAQRRGRRLPCPGRVTPRIPWRSPAPAAVAPAGSSGASPAGRSATAPTASRLPRRAARQRFICAGATGGSYQQWDKPWATACCATRWEAGACATRQHRHPGTPVNVGACILTASRIVVAAVSPVHPPAGPRPAARCAAAVPCPAARSSAGPCRVQQHGLGSPDMGLLSEDDIGTELATVPAWTRAGDSITCTVTLADFKTAMLYVGAVAYLAEHANHHPDVLIQWNKVTLTLSTHSAGA